MRLRPATPADAAAITAIYAPYVTDTAISFELEPPTPAEMEQRMGAALVWLVAEEEGEVLGYAYSGRHRDRAAYQWSVDVSVYIAPGRKRGGLGRALYAELFEQLRARGYYRAFAGITLPNPASEGLHRSLGFALVGVYHQVGYKLGRWHDVAWFERALRPVGEEPPDPPG